jgi:hypothetical protein
MVISCILHFYFWGLYYIKVYNYQTDQVIIYNSRYLALRLKNENELFYSMFRMDAFEVSELSSE